MVSIYDILNLRNDYPVSENKVIVASYKLAVKAHGNQKRARGVPYEEHLLEVGLFLARLKRDYEVISAGILHDVVEDTPITLKFLKQKFGKRIAKLVDGASWIRVKQKGKLEKDWPATYQKICEYAMEDIDLIFIKLSDLRSNISEMHVPHKKEFMTHKAGPRNKTFFIPFFREVGLRKFAKRLDNETSFFVKRYVKETLLEYITKEDLKHLKLIISKMRYLSTIR